MMKRGMEVAQDYTVFNYERPIPQKYLNPQYRTILAGSGMKPASKYFSQGTAKRKLGRKPPPDALIMDNLETSLATTVNKARGNTSGTIVERFIKSIASTMFGHTVYSLDGPGTSISVSGPHGEFFNSDFALYIGGKHFPDGCCRPIRIHEVWRAL